MSLKTGESNMAIAGGTELLLHPDQWIPWSYNGYIYSSFLSNYDLILINVQNGKFRRSMLRF